MLMLPIMLVRKLVSAQNVVHSLKLKYIYVDELCSTQSFCRQCKRFTFALMHIIFKYNNIWQTFQHLIIVFKSSKLYKLINSKSTGSL